MSSIKGPAPEATLENDVRIRAAQPEDASELAGLLGELGYPSSEEFVLGRLSELENEGTAELLVAQSGNRLAGFLAFDSQALFHQAGRIGCIMALCVAAEYRGKGVGHLLVREVEAIARTRGCIKISVASGVLRLEAHRFYLSLGYEENTKRFLKALV